MADSQGAAKAAPRVDEQKIEQEASWLGKRLSEPSTYAGLGILLGVVLHFKNADLLAADIQTIGLGLGAVILGIVAIITPEAGNKRSSPASSGPGNPNFTGMLVLLTIGAALALAAPRPAVAQTRQHRATESVPLPQPRPSTASFVGDAPPAKLYDSVRPTVAQATQNPLVVLRQFTVADLQAALADAKTQTPPDTVAAACYTALIPFVQSQAQNPLPAGAGVFQALQKARDAKAYLANIQSPTGPLAGLNTACAPLVLDVQNTLLTLGISVGVIANPAGAAATLGGLPAAVASFLALPRL